ncbi:MAG: ACT domain-containing protein [Acutalibacteraceae bacterium]
MIIEQISVFLENKPGELLRFTQVLAENKIDLQALSIAESDDYGILRIIVDKPTETLRLLREQNLPSSVARVIAVNVPDEPGSLTNILSVLANGNINLAYSYAFLSKVAGKACIVLRVDDNAVAEKLLEDAGIL